MKARDSRGDDAGLPSREGLSGSFVSPRVPRPPSRIRLEHLHVFLLPLLLVVLGIATVWRVALLQHRADVDRLRESVRAELEPTRGDLSRELHGAIQLTQGLASLIAVEGGLSGDRFQAVASELLQQNSVIRNIALAPDNVITQIHPQEGNERALGFAYASNPDTRSLMRVAPS